VSMADWSTVSSIGTAAGTLILAIATFSSVRSSQRTARVAERSLLLGIRPVLAPARPTDPDETIGFGDGHRLTIGGGFAAVEEVDEHFYLALGLRNVGPGLAVLHSWHLTAGGHGAARGHADPDDFRRLQRDLYVPTGDSSFWQGAIRDTDDPFRQGLAEAIAAGGPIALQLLYGDHEGGQRTISRFALTLDDETGRWVGIVLRHWQLDADDPR
jgi:hypothetical protein